MLIILKKPVLWNGLFCYPASAFHGVASCACPGSAGITPLDVHHSYQQDPQKLHHSIFPATAGLNIQYFLPPDKRHETPLLFFK